jgi:hypothetical protein
LKKKKEADLLYDRITSILLPFVPLGSGLEISRLIRAAIFASFLARIISITYLPRVTELRDVLD